MQVTIRPERPADEAAIATVTRAAFASHPFSRQTEAAIVAALRRAGALSISLVAERAAQVVGQIAFSPVELADGSPGWYGVGPLSVLPALQGQGIGRALVEGGLEALRRRAAAGCVLVGEPAFYRRFGFVPAAPLSLAGVPPANFLCLSFGPTTVRGPLKFHPAFEAEA